MAEAPLARRTRSGPGRLLIAVYAVFAIAASSRSAVRLGTRFEEAPLAYVLATGCLAMGSRAPRRVAMAAVSVELVGLWWLRTTAHTPA